MVVLRTMAQNSPQTQTSSLQKINVCLKPQAQNGFVDVDLYGRDVSLQQNGAVGSPFSNLEDNSVRAVRFRYSLEFLGQESDASSNLLAIFRELYRVCADGALIEITAVPATILQNLPTCQRVINAPLLAFFDANQRHALAADARLTQALAPLEGLNFRILYTSVEVTSAFKQAAGALQQQQPVQLAQLLNQHPEMVRSTTFYLVCCKSEQSTFALARVPFYEPFVMRTYQVEHSIYLAYQLAAVGVWEESETLLFRQLLLSMLSLPAYKDGLKIANIGANVGWYTVLGAKTSDKIKVDAFEPTPQTLQYLQQNIALSGLNSQVTVYPVALSNEAGQVELVVNDQNDGNNMVFASQEVISKDREQCKHFTIQAQTLDDVYGAQPQSDWPNFVLMDTEGHEQLVLDGSTQLWTQGWRPVIMTEFAPHLMKLRGECHYIQDLVTQYGYKVYVLVPSSAGKHAPSVLVPSSLEAITERYQLLASEETNPQGKFMNLLFVPPQLQITRSGLQQANAANAQ